MFKTAAEIKKEFFAYRNGIVAETLRKNKDPHTFIMGCQLVDIIDIASRTEHSARIATEMWKDVYHRECRMIAPMLYPVEEMTREVALSWAEDVECNEVADVLCHRLLRKLPFAQEIAAQLIDNENCQCKYTGLRLLLNLLITGQLGDITVVSSMVKRERAAQSQRDIVQLLDSIEEEI